MTDANMPAVRQEIEQMLRQAELHPNQAWAHIYLKTAARMMDQLAGQAFGKAWEPVISSDNGSWFDAWPNHCESRLVCFNRGSCQSRDCKHYGLVLSMARVVMPPSDHVLMGSKAPEPEPPKKRRGRTRVTPGLFDED